MPLRGSPEINPAKIRIRNADGTINVHCRRCGHYICTMAFTGIYTALCYYCEQGIERPLTPQEELLNTIYDEVIADNTIEKLARPKDKFNFLDMVVNTFQAMGFMKKKEEINAEEVEYTTADKETSKQVARRKKREPIFKKKEKS